MAMDAIIKNNDMSSAQNYSLSKDEQQKIMDTFSQMLIRDNLNEDEIKQLFKPFQKELESILDTFKNSNHTEIIEKIGLIYLKEQILNWNLYHPSTTIYFDLVEKEDRQAFSKELNQAIEGIQTKTDLVQFFQNGTYSNLCDRLRDKPCYSIIEQNIENYLDSDYEASKLRFLDTLSFGLKEDNFYKKILQNAKKLNIYNTWPEAENLNKDFDVLPKSLGLNSISYHKMFLPDEIISFILKSTDKVKEVFELGKDDMIGFNQLSLNFATYHDATNVANYQPSPSTIFMNVDCLKEGTEFFVHEYTHYLQDLALSLEGVSYKKHESNKFKGFKEWSEIETILRSSTKPNAKTLIEQFMKAFHPNESQDEKIALMSEEAKSQLSDKFSFIESSLEHLFNSTMSLKELKNALNDSSLLNEHEKIKYFKNIKQMFQAFHDNSYEISLWKKLDKDMKAFYFQKNFEVHARLVEQLVKPRFHYAVGEAKMEQIKPILTQFNHLLMSLAKEGLNPTISSNIEKNLSISEKVKTYRDKLNPMSGKITIEHKN
jgi:hypothetical protein